MLKGREQEGAELLQKIAEINGVDQSDELTELFEDSLEVRQQLRATDKSLKALTYVGDLFNLTGVVFS